MEMMSYYFVSMCVIAVALIVFALRFEGRRPRAREIVVLAVMVALAVAGRAAFFMLPQFKPVAALVIITGVALGAESGFLVGVLAAFVSNFLFGQGPWTPFQMMAFGCIGLVAGLLFHRRNPATFSSPAAPVTPAPSSRFTPAARSSSTFPSLPALPPTRILLCLYGGISVMFVYGIIVDIASILLFTESVTLTTALATLVAGVPFNFIHAVATVLFLLVLARPMLQKLERIKRTFGLLQR